METRNNKHATVYVCYNANGYNVAIHNTTKIIQHTYGVHYTHYIHTCMYTQHNVHMHTDRHKHKQTHTHRHTHTGIQSAKLTNNYVECRNGLYKCHLL